MVRSLTFESSTRSLFLLLALIVTFFISSATLFEQVDVVFYAVALWGIWGYFKFFPNKVLPKELRVEVYLIWSSLLIIFLGLVATKNWEKLFEFRFQSFRDTIWIYFIALLFVNYRLNAQTIWKIIVLSGLYALLYSLLIVVEETQRGTGLLETPIARGNLGMLFGVLSLLAFLGLKGKAWKLMALITMISGIMLSLLSGSRGGWLTVLLVFMTLVVLLPKIDKKFNHIIWGIVAVLGVVLYLMWHELPVEQRILQTLNSIQAYMNGNAHTSLGYRFEMWKAAYWAFLEKPLFGWGFDNFNVYFQKYLNEGLVVGKLWGHPHNDYMLLLSEKGVLGFVIVLSVLLYPFVVMLKYARKAIQTKQLEKLSLALTGMVLIEALMEFMLSDQTITMKFQYHLYVVLILMIMSALWFYDTESSKIEEEIKDETRSS